MAQITIKGFISADIKIDKVGQKQVERARMSVVDDSRSKKVGFFVDFWDGNVDLVRFLKKGNRVIVKATVDDGSYELEQPDKSKKRIFALNYNGYDIVRELSGSVDLDEEFERCKKASASKSMSNESVYPELTPTTEALPNFSAVK